MNPNIVTDVSGAIDNQPYILIIWSCDYNVFKSQLKASRSLKDWFCLVVWPFFKVVFFGCFFWVFLLWVKNSQQKQSQVFKEYEVFSLKYRDLKWGWDPGVLRCSATLQSPALGEGVWEWRGPRGQCLVTQHSLLCCAVQTGTDPAGAGKAARAQAQS